MQNKKYIFYAVLFFSFFYNLRSMSELDEGFAQIRGKKIQLSSRNQSIISPLWRIELVWNIDALAPKVKRMYSLPEASETATSVTSKMTHLSEHREDAAFVVGKTCFAEVSLLWDQQNISSLM